MLVRQAKFEDELYLKFGIRFEQLLIGICFYKDDDDLKQAEEKYMSESQEVELAQ